MAKRIKVKQETPPTLVWAYKELEELENRTGFITCEGSLAKKLLREGRVQDPRIGASALKHIEYAKPVKTTKAKPKATKEK